MTRRSQSWYRHNNAKERREKILQRSRKGVLAREANRMTNAVEPEPKFVRFYPLQFAIRDARNGDVSFWYDLKSGRDLGRRIGLLLREYAR